jgi:hypothetical protein
VVTDKPTTAPGHLAIFPSDYLEPTDFQEMTMTYKPLNPEMRRAAYAAIYAGEFLQEAHECRRLRGVDVMIEPEQMLRFHEEAETVANIWLELNVSPTPTAPFGDEETP